MIQTFRAQQEFQYQGKFCSIRTDHLPRGFAPHSHDYVEIAICVKGTADHQIDEQVFPIQVGSIHVVQGKTVHGFKNCSEDFVLLNIGYVPEFLPENLLRQMAGYQALFVLEPAYRQKREYNSHMVISGRDFSRIIDHVRCMQKEIIDHSPGYDCMLQAGFIQLVVMLSRMYEQGNKPRSLLHLSSAVAHMETHFTEPLSIDELAHMAHMSRRNFFRAFKETFEQTPLEYLLCLRVREGARLLLSRPDMSVGEISNECGFEDSNYFSRQFRRHFHCSPRTYRSSKKS